MAVPIGTISKHIIHNLNLQRKAHAMDTATQQQPAKTWTPKDIYQEVTDTIVAQLEAGVVPWRKPWTGDDYEPFNLPQNMVTGNRYNGINIVLLWGSSLKNGYQTDDWASFKQWQTKKESIRKGEKGSMVVYYDTFEKEVEGEIQKIPFLKSSFVYNRCQLLSYQAAETPETTRPPEPIDPIEKMQPVENFVDGTKAAIEHTGNKACYRPATDKISMPKPEKFKGDAQGTATEKYYATLLHEIVHWSGAEKRMNRNNGKKFGDQNYANEELVAEFGAAFLCAGFGMATVEKGGHAGYIDSWLKAIKENNRCLFTAASEASKAVEYLKGIQPK